MKDDGYRNQCKEAREQQEEIKGPKINKTIHKLFTN